MQKLSVERLYSRREIKLAGRLLGKPVQRAPEVEEAFRVLHNWRSHHSYPMVRERAKLTRLVKPFGGLTAGRLKRTSSIRKKLFRESAKLDQMQDLVGCRAVFNTMDDLEEVLSKYESVEDGGTVRRKADYIANPKESGYRSVHLVLKFRELGIGQRHAGCNVEIQLRTHLQHVWGTTVEAAGSMRNEDLKAGEGSREWLRFMSLFSGHIAELEGQPRGEHLSMSYKDLKAEIRELSSSLNVRQNLSTYSEFMHEADSAGSFYGSRYTLKMDSTTGDINVTPAWREMFVFDDLDDDFEETKQSLEVSVDNMTALRQAYPNYFADTREFLEMLDDFEQPMLPDKKTVIDKLDLSFLTESPARATERSLYLEYTGKVHWGGEVVGQWEKSYNGFYSFFPGNKRYVAFQSRNLLDFEDSIKNWLEGK